MKKLIISAMLCAALNAPSVSAMYGDEVRISVVVVGETLEFEDQQPVIIGGRTLVPVRGVMEALGARVDWNDAAKSAQITRDGMTVSLTIGESYMVAGTGADAVEIPLDTAPRIINGRTCLPIRAVAEAFGASVQWDDSRKTIIIN